MTVDAYLIYLAAVAVFFATPPDTSQLLIISNSIRHGLRQSVYTIAGDLSANCIQMTAAAFGLATIISASATAFIWIKWFGVAYLAWIGVQLILSKDQKSTVSKASPNSPIRLFRQGFVTSMANPFAIVFFAALFPQFINPNAEILPQLLVLGITYIVIDGAILLFWGAFAVRAASTLKVQSLSKINRFCGSLMIIAAGLLATNEIKSE